MFENILHAPYLGICNLFYFYLQLQLWQSMLKLLALLMDLVLQDSWLASSLLA